MNAWLAVFKKDFRMAAPWLLTGLLIILSIDLIALLTVENRKQIDLKCIFHLFSHPVLSLLSGCSLEREKKQMHLWLHSPLPPGNCCYPRL